MAVNNRDVRAPDITTSRQGTTEYWEVKYRSRSMVDQETGEHEHWMPYDAFEDYSYVSEQTGIRVHIVLYEAPTSTNNGCWLLADVDALLEHGRRSTRIAHDGTSIDAWVWQRRAMRVVDGPPIDHSAQLSEPLFPVEGSGAEIPSTVLDPVERSLRNRRRGAILANLDTQVSDPAERLLAEDRSVGLDIVCRRLGLPALPRYSVWLSGVGPAEIDDALALLDYGIRVHVVTADAHPRLTGQQTATARSAGLLQVALLPGAAKFSIVDGHAGSTELTRSALDAVDQVVGINVEQYRIIHAPPSADIAVLAGAGTGKTETMAERIVFLLATVRNDPATRHASTPRLDQIALVTFTREAAAEMRGRLARTLMLRQRLCPLSTLPVLAWLLQLSGTQISTIHAFARELLVTYGGATGVAPNFNVTSRGVEFRHVLADQLSAALEDLTASDLASSVPPAHEWYRHISAVLDHLENNGVNVAELDWGDYPSDPLTAEIQQLTKDCVEVLAIHSASISRSEQALRLVDLVPTALLAVSLSVGNDDSIRYVFVDEFQDTDLSQLQLFSRLRTRLGASLFVVGDVKQGIYRFRGASGDAFDELDGELESTGVPRTQRMTLTRNFRSAPELLYRMHSAFVGFGRAGLLQYGPDDRLRAGRPPSPAASMEIKPVASKKGYAKESAAIVAGWRRDSPTDSVGIVCRRNSEALAIQRELRQLGLSCEIAVGGLFFLTPAVRELHAFLRAIADPSDGAASAQLSETRWIAGLLRERPPFRLGSTSVGPWELPTETVMGWNQRLAALAQSTNFPRNDLSLLELRLSELRTASAFVSPLQFVADCVREFDPCACSHPDTDDEVERRRYSRCLDHLLSLLDAEFPSGGGSLVRLVDWLELSIAMNRSEDEPVATEEHSGTTIALSVHKAKGLQYDRVLIPRTWIDFGPPDAASTEVVVAAGSPRRVGWSWKAKERTFSTLDAELRGHESGEVAREETRLLYVAMTRAKYRLCVLVGSARPPGTIVGSARSWEDLMLGRTR